MAASACGADRGRSGPLLTLRSGDAMLAGGVTEDDVDAVPRRNPRV